MFLSSSEKGSTIKGKNLLALGVITIDEALPGVLGNRRIMKFISGEQENKGNFGEQGT